MIRGTTPTHTFTLPFDVARVKQIRILYAQNRNVLVTKETADCVMEGSTVSVTLTQEDTFKFDCEEHVQIQLRVLTTDGQALSTPIKVVDVGTCLDTEVIA